MKKREVPSYLKLILKIDQSVTNQLCSISEKFAVTRSLKRQAKALEYSCHGIVWLAAWLLFIWICWLQALFQMQVNFFVGLILDIIFVAVLKAVFRRRRPIGNKGDVMSLGPDKYSFPSGHVSRAVLILYFFTTLYPISFIFLPPLFAWCFSVSYTRILLRRHHLLDVLGGVVLGILEGLLLSCIWLSHSTAIYLISWITDEQFEGGEYHV